MKRAADIDAIVQDLRTDFAVLRHDLTGENTHPISVAAEVALARLETFCAVSVRVLRGTNPSRIRDAARTEEILARIHKREVLEDD